MAQQEQKSSGHDFDQIWKLMMENRKQMKETDRQMQETDRRMQETDRRMQETDRRMQETDRIVKETSLQMKETDRQLKTSMAETDKKLNKFIGETGNRWGALGENLVEGNLAKRLKEKGIVVEKALTRVRTPQGEFDIIAVNGKEVVVVEVRCTLDPSDVDEFVEKMKKFKTIMPEYKDKNIYGAMAFLMNVSRNSDTKAEKQGFFVIKATGDVVITNKKNFKPKVFH